MRRGLWRACGAVAVAALSLLGGCDRATPRGTSGTAESSPAPSEAPSAATGGAPATPPPAEPAVGAGAFDVGEIKTAAEYLLDPELGGADLERGKLLSLACAACHTFGAGQKPIVGPNLHGVFGRPAASGADFAYSPALRASRLVWTPRSLEAWLADPATFVAGTTMTFTGYRSAADRRALIAYLLSATQ